MSKLSEAIQELYLIETEANKNEWINNIHPLVKLFLTILYICLVVSFPKYNIMGVLGMGVYPLIVFLIGNIRFLQCVKRIKYILPIVCIIGLFNPLFDNQVITVVGGLKITGGMISFITLIIKGVFTVLAAYLLIITTTIEGICYAMKKIHIPQSFITIILLIYRYINVLLKEAERIICAYSLRAPNQKGIHFKVWGSLIGQLLLRSMDRASDIYDSMNLRGYEVCQYNYGSMNKKKVNNIDIIWSVMWTLTFIFIRKVPILILIGNIFV